MDHETKAKESTNRADKIRLYNKAYIRYQDDENLTKASEMGLILAELEKDVNPYIAALSYSNTASIMHRNNNYDPEISKKAIAIYLDEGKFFNAAREYVKIGDCVSKVSDRINAYENAVKYYNVINHSATASYCEEKICYLHINENEWDKAIIILSRLISYHYSTSLTKFKCKTLILHVLLCHLVSSIDLPLDEYWNRFPDCMDTIESRFIMDLQNACRERNVDKFNLLCKDWFSIRKDEPEIDILLTHIRQYHFPI